MRIALYSHDALGLGHLRRNLAIAGALSQADTSTLLVTGVREAGAFAAPEGVDYLTLPGYTKAGRGEYHARFLDIGTERLVALRSATMCAALAAYAPDVLIVDKHPLGLNRELRAALELVRAQGTRCVLGLRDVLDREDRVRREWAAAGSEAAVREFYDQVWVYGDPRVYDVVERCALGAGVRERVRYTGYLSRRRAPRSDRRAAADRSARRLALCMVGGGEDGYAVAEVFARASMPDGTDGMVVTGPLMPPSDRRRLRRAAGRRVEVVDFLAAPEPVLDRAAAVVSMGGYNAVCELLGREKRALVVPRVVPRVEQLIRSTCLDRRRLVEMLHPARASAASVGDWLAQAPRARGARGPIDLGGLRRLPGLVEELLHGSRGAGEQDLPRGAA